MRTILPCVALVAAILASSSLLHADSLPNLALKKTAAASSTEDGNPAENAIDDNPDTRWCAADESTPASLTIDLGKEQTLGGAELLWEHDGAVYQYVIEGSTDNKSWKPLNDQRATTLSTQSQKLALENLPARYVRLTVTGVESSSWASLFEVKLHDADAMKKLSPAELKAYLPSVKPDDTFAKSLALKKTASASSEQDGHPAADANDGNLSTRWCASDETVPQWWKTDLGEAKDLSEITLRWELDKNYKFILESSTDDKTWKVLVDRSQSTDAAQTQKLPVTAKAVRYLRLTVKELEEGAWASLSEFAVK